MIVPYKNLIRLGPGGTSIMSMGRLQISSIIPNRAAAPEQRIRGVFVAPAAFSFLEKIILPFLHSLSSIGSTGILSQEEAEKIFSIN